MLRWTFLRILSFGEMIYVKERQNSKRVCGVVGGDTTRQEARGAAWRYVEHSCELSGRSLSGALSSVQFSSEGEN